MMIAVLNVLCGDLSEESSLRTKNCSSEVSPVSAKDSQELRSDIRTDESSHVNGVDVLIIHHDNDESAAQDNNNNDVRISDDDDDDDGGHREEEAAVVPYEKEDNLDNEIRFFDRAKEEDDDYFSLDQLLERCPRTEIIRNLESVLQVSKSVTNHLEKAVKKWSRISRGPFPRPQGSSQTKAEVIDAKSPGLIRESARFLQEMNKIFFGFSAVTERLDIVQSSQKRHVKSVKKERARKQKKPPRKRQVLAALYLAHRQEGEKGQLRQHKSEALLGERIPPTIAEEER